MIEQAYFEELGKFICSGLHPGEHVSLNLYAETSQFLRFSKAKVRQEGTVRDASLELTFLLQSEDGVRKTVRSFSLTGLTYLDRGAAGQALEAARKEAGMIPIDPYAQVPSHGKKSLQITSGQMPAEGDSARCLLDTAQRHLRSLELVGYLASGRMIRGVVDSSGSSHWFQTERLNVDYSVYAPNQKAAKASYSSDEWKQEEWEHSLAASCRLAELLNQPVRRVEPGTYRTFLSNECVSNLVQMLSWYAIGERYLRQGISPLAKMRAGERFFSPMFHLDEDFSSGRTPRFNQEGDLAPLTLPLIHAGRLRHTLVSAQSAKEFGVESNGANAAEMLRAATVHPGTLKDEDALKRLDTGLDLSNLHYLNWSDQASGRVTGMTRFACFWVENGKRVAPIENLRFDDTLFELFGSNLEALGNRTQVIPDSGTYERRSLDGVSVPSALVSKMRFTL